MSWHEMLHIIILNIRTILKITVLVTVFLFFILFFVYPRTYQASVLVLPPAQENGMGGFGSLLGKSDFSSFISGGMSSANSQLLVEILRSRTAALYVVDKLDLVKKYSAKNRIEAAEMLVKKLNTEISKEGIIKISVDVKSSMVPLFLSDLDSLKKMAATISNTYIESLDSINKEKLSSKAKNARKFIERQIIETRGFLDSAEYALMNFQSKNKTISLSEQVKAAIDASTKLKSEIVETEIKLGLVKSDVSESNRLVIALAKKLEELKNQYSKFENGDEDYLLAFKDLPTLGKQLASLIREVKIQNEVYVLLQQQFYKEKIQENRDLPTIEILDEAIPPDKKTSPKVLVSSILGMLIVFLSTSLFFVLSTRKK